MMDEGTGDYQYEEEDQYSEAAIEKSCRAGRVAAQALRYGRDMVKPGVSILETVEKVENLILEKGLKVAFPVNIAINNIAAHFTPRHDDGPLVFEQGQVVKIDVGAHLDGYIADTALTVEVGTRNWGELIEASREGLTMAIEMMRPGVDLSKIGEKVQETIGARGFKPISNLTGHSLERFRLHAGLSIPNIKEKMKGDVKTGARIAIEPFATNGSGRVDGRRPSNIYRFLQKKSFITKPELRKLERHIIDNFGRLPFAERWCTKVVDDPQYPLKKLVRAGVVSSYPILQEMEDDAMISQAEHTVLITDDGCEIITDLK